MGTGEIILLSKTTNLTPADIFLPASKSESNRALIVSALSDQVSRIHNLSEARDTRIMKSILDSDPEEWDARDAGTTFRFLTAFAAITRNSKVLTGTPRMKKRPIGILVEALKAIGARIDYLGEQGYPPLRIHKFQNQKEDIVRIQGNVSSQYISALMMIAPLLENGLTIEFTSKVTSVPYLKMTASIMEVFGVIVNWDEKSIHIPFRPYESAEISIESDWSAASYWYSLVALAENAEVKLDGLRKSSFQGDQEIMRIMEKLGVHTEFSSQAAYLTKKESLAEEMQLDFVDCPDLAQTIAVICAAKKIPCKMTGLESLRIKETDRILALQNELAKIGAQLKENEAVWHLIPGNDPIQWDLPLRFETYEDHRMAMSFAPLATLGDIRIEDPKVVNKSYPGFWIDLQKAGVIVN